MAQQWHSKLGQLEELLWEIKLSFWRLRRKVYKELVRTYIVVTVLDHERYTLAGNALLMASAACSSSISRIEISMVLVRSFIRVISPILRMSARSFYLSRRGRAIPVYKCLSAKDHGEELGRVLCGAVSVLQL